MTIEKQLLKIIVEQQQQQEVALKRLEQQALTISALEDYSSKLLTYSSKLQEKNKELEEVIRKLRTLQFSEQLLMELETDLRQQLQKRLTQLVDSLEIESQVVALVKSLPNQVQAEIEIQLKPLTAQVVERMASVEAYQQRLASLTETLSSKL